MSSPLCFPAQFPFGNSGSETARRNSVGWTVVGVRRGRTGCGRGRAGDGRTGAWHLLRTALHRASPGGKVKSAPLREYGHAEVEIEDGGTALFAGLPATIQVWMSHGDEAETLPGGFHRTAITSNALAGIVNEERRIWAVQFHPEVHHTPLGPQLIRNLSSIFARRRATGRPRIL